MKVDILVPCLIDQFKPETAFNMIKVLEKAGCEVNYNSEQTCCGLPAFNAGYWNEAREVGEKFLNESDVNKHLICAGAACTSMVRNSYDLLFQNSSYHNRFRNLQRKTFELSEFLVDVLQITSIGSVLNAKAILLDSCSARNECNIQKQPRQLLQAVEGLQLIESEDKESCCGFGGSFSVNFSEASVKLAEVKVNEALDKGAEIIVSTDYGCLLHLDMYLKKTRTSLRVMHIADVLAQGI